MTALWFACWLVLTGSGSGGELAVGAACALLAAGASEVAWGAHLTMFSADPRLLRAALLIPPWVVVDTGRVVGALIRYLTTGQAPRSQLRVVSFDPGPPTSARAAARRALTIGLFTLPPNSIAIGIDAERRQLLYHQLVAAPLPRLLRLLGVAA